MFNMKQFKIKFKSNHLKKFKIFLFDIFDFTISFLQINKTKLYRNFIIQSSISQLIRGKTHTNKNFISFLKLINKYIFLFLRIIKHNYIADFYPKNNNKTINNLYILLIVYPDNDNWILKGLSLDLEKEISKLNIKVKACSMANIYKFKFVKILFIHHKVALKAVKKNPALLDISSIYLSHIRTISLKEIELLSKFNFIFCQSAKDQMRLYSLGVLPGRIIHLPIGFDHNMFFEFKKYDERKYDFVISTPLKINSLGSHYWLRKSSPLIHETLNKLGSEGYKVLIIGEGWNNSLLSNNKNIDIVNCSYREKNNFLNECKTFLNLSLIEGGPVTLLEAIAAGCNCISKNNGFSSDIAIEFPQKCKDIKNIVSSEQLSKEIINLYQNNFSYEKAINSSDLHSYSFNYLGKKIMNILNI